MSDVRVQGTKSCNGAVRDSAEISGKEGDSESLGFAIKEKVDPQPLSKRRKSKISLFYFPGFGSASRNFFTKLLSPEDAAKNCQDVSTPTGNPEKSAEGKKFVEKSVCSVSQKARKCKCLAPYFVAVSYLIFSKG